MTKKRLDEVKVIVLCIVIAFFLMISLKAEAQTSHVVDTVKYEYFDLKERPIRNSFFAEKTMGWSMWMLACNGVRKRKVWVNTIKK